ncbi:hypothetical protein EUGRSUZ_D00666 [Eucalyptus grandis]|uniref:Uncharacterized protein n=1 Tax=Eucalyptus grandis TaxID=71139 RepID=A0ACC3L410_EUCGR|nr:hypothetical protein EUGRSUZ_D00666 [Eucalyptus grandis]
MESQKSSIQSLINMIKRDLLSVIGSHSFLSPSPYDTAWLAMIPDPRRHDRPMFEGCLNWVLHNQNEEGFWGYHDCDRHEMPDGVGCLASTLVCMIVLKKWYAGSPLIEKGLKFIHKNAELLLSRYTHGKFSRWIAIVLPGMVELARASSLEVVFPESVDRALEDLFINRRQILKMEELVDKNQYCPLLSYLEALPSTYKISHETILKHLDSDGSLFQSPSATSRAYLSTGNEACLAYLQSLASNCASSGIPSFYPVDEDLTKLSMVHQLVRLGLTEYFDRENDEILAKIYRLLYKDCLEFWLLRMHGYRVSPSSFCWFLDHEEIEHELGLPWMARLDHLEHRTWMEEKDACVLWMGKFQYNRPSFVHNQDIVQLALQNYVLRQSVYRMELDVVKRWSETTGLRKMGFGREKTLYSYFAVAASISLPCNSDVRVLVAKSAIMITVADDFFDMEGSLEDLEKLTNAVQRWDGEGLTAHAKTIFEALDDLVTDFRMKCFKQSGKDIKKNLQEIWGETFHSWLMEAKWSKSGGAPPTQEYLDVGMTSIAAHILVLPSSCLASPTTPLHQLWSNAYQPITKLLMVITRLLNDIQSYEAKAKSGRCSLSGACLLLLLLWTYIHSLILSPCFYDFLTLQKEEKQGKLNFVLLYLKENPEASIEDSINFVQLLLEQLKKEFLLHVLEELCNLPEPSRRLHLGCLKVFHMFFNSSNRYDSETGMLHDIQKALVVPPRVPKLKPLRPLPEQLGPKPREFVTKSLYGQVGLERFPRKSFVGYRISSRTGPVDRWEKMYKSSNFKLCFA